MGTGEAIQASVSGAQSVYIELQIGKGAKVRNGTLNYVVKRTHQEAPASLGTLSVCKNWEHYALFVAISDHQEYT